MVDVDPKELPLKNVFPNKLGTRDLPSTNFNTSEYKPRAKNKVQYLQTPIVIKHHESISAEDWKIADHYYCINLLHRKDRFEECSAIFKSLNLTVEFFHPVPHPTDGRIGCFEAHVDIIKDALKRGFKRIGIFEDDINLNVTNIRQQIIKIGKFLEEKDEDHTSDGGWNIFFLGCIPEIRYSKTKRTKVEDIYQIAGLCTHAYLINTEMMRKMASQSFIGIAIDHLYAKLGKCFTVSTPLFIQGNSVSDIHKNVWDSLPRPLARFLVDSYTSFVNWYCYRVNVPFYSGRFNIIAILTTILVITLYFKKKISLVQAVIYWFLFLLSFLKIFG